MHLSIAPHTRLPRRRPGHGVYHFLQLPRRARASRKHRVQVPRRLKVRDGRAPGRPTHRVAYRPPRGQCGTHLAHVYTSSARELANPQKTRASAAPPPTPSTRGKRPSPRTQARASSQRWSQSAAARARTAHRRKTPRPRRIAVERELARAEAVSAWPEREAVNAVRPRGIATRGRRLLAAAVLVLCLNVA